MGSDVAKQVRRMAALVTATVLLTSCSEGGPGGDAAQDEGQPAVEASPSTATSSPSSSSSSQEPSSPTSSSTTSLPSRPTTEDSDSADTTGSDEAEPPVVTGSSSAPQDLGLADFFVREGWQEGELQVPRESEPVQAISTEVSLQYSSRTSCENVSEFPSAPPLELRLAAESGTVSFTFSQALTSATSDTLLDVKLLADNRTADTATVPFQESRTLSVEVVGVSSVRVEIAVNGDSPSCSTTAVVRDVQLTSG